MPKSFLVQSKLVEREKANVPIIKKYQRKKFKEELIHHPDDRTNWVSVPDEFNYVKNFMGGKQEKKKKEEELFDYNDDKKPLNIKKESRIDKMRKPFKIINGKKFYGKYHSV
tara:strand:+ start:479 stop:814 length:336 start_codon:yes stop_codon:yes gene_type:complete